MHPTRLGPYTLGTRLGRGGMGAVFEAADDAGHPVAVKLLATHLLDDPALRGRFEAEIATLKTLRHPSIVQLIAFGEDDGQPYFAMELVQGRSLEQLLRAGRRFGWRETVSAAQAVARGLKVAHDHGVIHRDLKPANLLVAEGDDGDLGSRLKLADFGIAKLFGGSSHTAHGNVVGTAEYMAPEQAAGLPVDPRVDVYALGLVMFAMLSGKPPFVGAEPSEVIRRQQHEAPPRVSTFAADVPVELDLLIERMLSKDPAGRPASALALGRLLAAIDVVHQPSSSASGPADPSAPRPAAEEVDLYALTRDLGGLADPVVPGMALPLTRAATGAAAGNTTKPVDRQAAPGTGAGPAAATVVERGPSSRFTTVAELDRAAEERASRDRAIERRWQAISAAVMLGLFVACGYLLFRTPSADELFARILAARDAAKDGGDLRDAAPVMREFLDRFPDDPRAEQVATLTRSLALDRLERWARRRPLTGRALTPVERDYRAAMEREAESPSTCRDALQALIALHASDRMPPDGDADTDDPGLWIDLARRQIDRLEPAAAREQAEDARRIADIFRRADALAADAAQADGAAREDALVRRRELLESVVELYQSRAHAAPAVAEAKKQLGGDVE